MDIFLFAFNGVFPLVLIVAFGYFLKRIELFDELFIKQANKFCFMAAFPLQLFYNIYHIDFNKRPNISLMLFIVASILIMVAFLIIVVPRVIKDSKKRGAFIQGAYRSNFLLIGLPLAKNLFGDVGVAAASLALPLVVPIYNFCAVLVLSMFSEKNKELKFSYARLIVEIIKNPLIIASLLGLLFGILGFNVPIALDNGIRDVGSIATPLALVLLGGQFCFSDLAGNLKYAISASFLRIILLPLIVIIIAVLFGFRGIELSTILIIFASPSAISGYVMAQNMYNDAQLAGQIIVITTFSSAATLFAWIYLLRLLEFI